MRGHDGSKKIGSVHETDHSISVASVVRIAKQSRVARQASWEPDRWQHAVCEPLVPLAVGSHGTAPVTTSPVTEAGGRRRSCRRCGQHEQQCRGRSSDVSSHLSCRAVSHRDTRQVDVLIGIEVPLRACVASKMVDGLTGSKNVTEGAEVILKVSLP